MRRVVGKGREHTRKRYGPTGGWAMRMSQRSIVPNLGRASGPGRSSMGLLESHATPGVVPHGLSIVHGKMTDKRVKRKRSSERTGEIVTLPRLLRECFHALRLHHQRCLRRACFRHRLPMARAVYRDGVGWGEADRLVVRRWGVLGEYLQPLLAREWRVAPVSGRVQVGTSCDLHHKYRDRWG